MKKSFKTETYIGILALIWGVTLCVVSVRHSWAEWAWKDTQVGVVRSFYIPSPLEIAVLENREDLWPKLFRPEAPLEPSRLPEFYDHILKGNLPDNMDSREIWAVRALAVAMAAGDLLRVEHLMPSENPPKNKVTAKNCQLGEVEVAFRRSRLSAAWKPRFQELLKVCDPRNVLNDWLLFEEALGHGNKVLAAHALGQLEARGRVAGKTFSRWFAAEAALVGDELMREVP
jgi:hypothetical protein